MIAVAIAVTITTLWKRSVTYEFLGIGHMGYPIT